MEKQKTGIISKNTSEFLKGIAIIMVVLSHYAEWGFNYFADSKIAEFLTSLGDVGVGVFFFVSGYGLYTKYGDKKTNIGFLKKRFVKVYIPYIILAFTIALLGGGIKIGRELICLISGYDYWFIFTIFLIYISFYLAGKFPRYSVLIESIFVIGMSLYFALMDYQVFWYSATWALIPGMLLAYAQKRFWPDGPNGDAGELVFAFIGRRSLYIYIIHTYIFWNLYDSEWIEKHQMGWPLFMLGSFALTVLLAWGISFVYNLLLTLIGRKYNKNL